MSHVALVAVGFGCEEKKRKKEEPQAVVVNHHVTVTAVDIAMPGGYLLPPAMAL
jgi:hypothetical protein